MKKLYLKSIVLALLLPTMNAHSFSRLNPPNGSRNYLIDKSKYSTNDSNEITQETNCSSIHVWYTLNNKDMIRSPLKMFHTSFSLLRKSDGFDNFIG